MILHILHHRLLTLTTLPWKRKGLLFGRPLLVAEYRARNEIHLVSKDGLDKIDILRLCPYRA
jgi:hypothetical protein